MSLAAADAADRVEQLIALTRRLTDRLAEEAEALEARRISQTADRLEETGRLANLYRREVARIKAEPDLIAGAPAVRREALKSAARTFEGVLARHLSALEAAKTLTEGIVQAIAAEVASGRALGTGYGPGARAAPGDARAVTLNLRS